MQMPELKLLFERLLTIRLLLYIIYIYIYVRLDYELEVNE